MSVEDAKVDRETQYEDITQLETLCGFHFLRSDQEELDVLPPVDEERGVNWSDKGTQFDVYSTTCGLETIEEENNNTTGNISHSNSDEFEDTGSGESFYENNYQYTLYEERVRARETYLSNRDYFDDEVANDDVIDDGYFIDHNLQVFASEDDGCIIDKLDPIEELSEADSLESFSAHEYEISRECHLAINAGNVKLESIISDPKCAISDSVESKTGELSEKLIEKKGERPGDFIEDLWNCSTKNFKDGFAAGTVENRVTNEPDQGDQGKSKVSEVAKETNISRHGKTKKSEISNHILNLVDSKNCIRMESVNNVDLPSVEARLPPEGAKTEPEAVDLEADDTHSVDSLEMIEAEKPPWDEEKPRVSPGPQEANSHANGVEAEEKADTVSQSGSSVADSLDSDQPQVNGGRQSSASDEGPSTPNKKESKLPIFIDTHLKSKSSQIPKPKSIRPQPGPPGPKSPVPNKETTITNSNESNANSVKELQNNDVTIKEKTKSRGSSLSPKQRRKSSSGSDVKKEKTPAPPVRSRQHTIDLGDIRPGKDHFVEPRETVASRKRLTAIQSSTSADAKETSDDYLTPLQRKEQTIKELRQEVKEAKKEIAERDIRLQMFNSEKEQDMELLAKEKNDVIEGLTQKYERLFESFNELQTTHEDVLRLSNDLELKLNSLKEEMTMREAKHQEMYLEMYNKGKDSAKFERLDELEKIAKDEPDKVTVEELLEKLKTTETELGYWQSLKRHDIYAESEKPDTEAAATLRFLKDSMFHYITDPKDSDSHFRAMIQIFGYTPVQMRTIEKILAGDKKHKMTVVAKSKSMERKDSK